MGGKLVHFVVISTATAHIVQMLMVKSWLTPWPKPWPKKQLEMQPAKRQISSEWWGFQFSKVEKEMLCLKNIYIKYKDNFNKLLIIGIYKKCNN